MITRTQLLIDRLDAIGQAVKETGRGVAVLGLGSAGEERQRLDAFSDLDFFVIARTGAKPYFLDSLAWLEAIQPVTFSFLNTADGYKLLFADGIFCEMAVFEAGELAQIPYTGAQVVWQDDASELSFPASSRLPQAAAEPPTTEWLLGEILSNLYVGLGRFRRGEKLSAARFIQGHAVDRLLELAPLIEGAVGGTADPFDHSRRFEQRFPRTAVHLPEFLAGYDQTPQAALAMLAFLESHFSINKAMNEAIHELALVVG